MSTPTAPDRAGAEPSDAREDSDDFETPAGARALGALLLGTALLRVGAVGAGAAVQFDLSDLAGGHPSNVAVGLVGAAQAAPEMVFAPLLARFADRLGRTRFLVGGPLLGVLGVLLVAGALQPSQIALARVLEGIGAAAFVPTALGTIAAATAHDDQVRARASGAFEGATLAGYAGGFVVGPFAYHWLHRGAFVVLASLYLAAGAVCWRLVPRVPPLPVSPLRVVLRTIVGPGPVRSFIPAWLAVNGLVGAWYFNLPALLKRAPDPGQTLVHGFDERVIGLFLLGYVVLLLAGIALWVPVLRRLGGPLTMRRAVPGAVLVCLSLLAVNHLPLRVAPLLLPVVGLGILVQAGFGPAAVAYLAHCSESLTADRAAMMAFYTVTLAGGGALGSVLGGIAARLLLFDGLIALGLVLSAVAWFSLAAVIRLETQRSASGAAPAGTHA